jgi:hypothetical protein
MTIEYLIRRTRARARVRALEQALADARRELARIEADEESACA